MIYGYIGILFRRISACYQAGSLTGANDLGSRHVGRLALFLPWTREALHKVRANSRVVSSGRASDVGRPFTSQSRDGHQRFPFLLFSGPDSFDDRNETIGG